MIPVRIKTTIQTHIDVLIPLFFYEYSVDLPYTMGYFYLMIKILIICSEFSVHYWYIKLQKHNILIFLRYNSVTSLLSDFISFLYIQIIRYNKLKKLKSSLDNAIAAK